MSRGTKKRSTFGIFLDFILVLLTGGLWFIILGIFEIIVNEL